MKYLILITSLLVVPPLTLANDIKIKTHKEFLCSYLTKVDSMFYGPGGISQDTYDSLLAKEGMHTINQINQVRSTCLHLKLKAEVNNETVSNSSTGVVSNSDGPR